MSRRRDVGFDTIRENWRVTLLVLLVLFSLFLVAPTGEESTGPTDLEYGLELSGGTRIRAPLVGLTAEGVNVTPANEQAIEQTVADSIEGVEITDVNARPPDTRGGSGTVEVFVRNVTREQFASALREAGLDVTAGDVREGVTEETRSTAVDVIDSKIDESGLSGGTVQQVVTSTGENFILIEVPNENRSSVVDLVESRGVVRVVARYPNATANGTVYEEQTVLTQGDFASVGNAEVAPLQPGGPQVAHVSVVLGDDAAREYAATMQETGFTSSRGTENCNYNVTTGEGGGYCLVTVVDGEPVRAFSLSSGLAADMESGDFTTRPQFVFTTGPPSTLPEARDVELNLRAGDIPAPLDIEGRGSTLFVQASLAQDFKLFSLVTGIVAVFAVAGTVFLRYGQPRVALPMVLTALSEVVLLLGFAAGVGLAMDLSHIAGFIAVIGTGVDDLVIIADEVLSEGEVRTGRVFQNRFRKAFWVIGAAAITTIIAMTPLAFLSLGDLQGFAIVTIVGVIAGVLVTRPAYGDILRALMTEQ